MKKKYTKLMRYASLVWLFTVVLGNIVQAQFDQTSINHPILNDLNANDKSQTAIYVDPSIGDLNNYLAGTENNNHVYQLFSHGRPGELFIQNQWMNAQQIASFLQSQLNANITHVNIYGCEFARGQIGEDAVAYLQNALNVTIAASNNITGKNGDWKLEVGQPEAAITISNYEGNLQNSCSSNIISNGSFENFQNCPGANINNFYASIVSGWSATSTPEFMSMDPLKGCNAPNPEGYPGAPIWGSASLPQGQDGYSWIGAHINETYTDTLNCTLLPGTYTLTFWAGYTNVGSYNTGSPLSVSDQYGTLLGSSAIVSNLLSSATPYNWQQYSITFTTVTPTNVLTFTPTAINSYLYLDNFSLLTNSCYAIPAITSPTVSNVCGSSTFNLNSLTNSGTAPAGTTLVWSLHNPPTGPNDTLTTAQAAAQVATLGTVYYAYYRNTAGGCFGPADSVVYVPACCNGTTSKSQYAASASGNANTSWGTDMGVVGAPDITSSATDVTSSRISVYSTPATVNFANPILAGDTITMYVRKWDQNWNGGCTVSLNGTPTNSGVIYTITSPQLISVGYPYDVIKCIVPYSLTGSYTSITLTPNNVGGNSLLLFDAIQVSNTTCIPCAAGTVAPSITATTLTNTCPTTTVNLTTLAQTGTVPTGTTLVWSTHNAPTSSTDTLTTAQASVVSTSGTYYAYFRSITMGCFSPADSIVVTIGTCPVANPDINATYVNVPVSGSVATNDIVPTGTTYGTPTTVPGYTNPSTSTPVMNSNGTYTFNPSAPGVYKFLVPVCVPGQVAPCPTQLLTITVLSTTTTNPPVANTDIASTPVNTPVTLNTLGNDAPGTTGTSLVPSTVSITDLNGTTAGNSVYGGTATVNSTTGAITYTPAPGFTGIDTVKYTVCDNQSPAQCASAFEIINVLPTGTPNTTVAADDYATTPYQTTVTGNVKTNDSDPQGNTQTVTAQGSSSSPITIAGVGSYYINSDGTYSFTPAAGFSGPVNIPYTTCDNGVPQACSSATLYITVQPPIVKENPDVNTTYVNVPVSGSVGTNDIVPAGTTYGTPTAVPGYTNPSTSTPVMNSNGTYTFNPSAPGVYEFLVPVCIPGQVAPCPPQLLTITVLSTTTTNPPDANTDIASTPMNTPVTLNTLSNDAPGTPGASLVPSTVTITDLNGAIAGNTIYGGTATVNSTTGAITYTPAPGFVGVDTVKYTVCDNQSPAQCASAYEIITVLPTGSTNTTVAADDYTTTPYQTTVTGNVKTNDSDPQGNTQTVTAQGSSTSPITIAGVGSYYLNSDGTYSFTPVAGFSGPVNIPYTTCDNGTPQACASATLYITVQPPAVKENPDVNATFVNVPVTGSVATNDNVPVGTTYGTPTIVPGYTNPSTSTPVMNSNGTYTFNPSAPGVYEFLVPICVPGQVAPCPPQLLTITVLNTTTTNPPVANTDIASTPMNTPVTLSTLSNDASGTSGVALVPSSVTITDLNGATSGNSVYGGTATVNSTTGAITYTPAPGFVGVDTVKYTVCDNQSPAQCANAFEIITVLPTGSANTTVAADDYATTTSGTPVSGNVKTNDSDPQGNTQTVTAQGSSTSPVTITGVGTYYINSDGTYSFKPVAGFTGPVAIPYTTCDNGTPQACASATLYITVTSVPDLTPTITLPSNNFAVGETKNFVVYLEEINGAATSPGTTKWQIKVPTGYTIAAYNGSLSSITPTGSGTAQTVQNSSFQVVSSNSTTITLIAKAGISISGYGVDFFGFTITRSNVVSNNSANITASIIYDASGNLYDSVPTNNSYSRVVTTQ